MAQGHLSHSDVLQLIANLDSDAKEFRVPLAKALRSDATHRTPEEQQDVALAARFNRETTQMLKDYKHGGNGVSGFHTVSGTAKELDGRIRHLKLNATVTDRWELIQADFAALDPTFRVPLPARVSSPATVP